MSPKIRPQFTSEQLSVARDFVVAASTWIEEIPLTESDWNKVEAFDVALMGLVRTAYDIAAEQPDYEAFEELRWVPIAKRMIKECAKEMPGAAGLEKMMLFDDTNVEDQVQLYRVAIENKQAIS